MFSIFYLIYNHPIKVRNQKLLFSIPSYLMFNQNSFSIDSANPQNNSFGSPQKRPSNQSNSLQNDSDYDFNTNLVNYNFKDVVVANPTSDPQLKTQPRISKENPFKKNNNNNSNMLERITQKPSNMSNMSDSEKPRGLLKQKMKVDYAFDHRKGQSEIVLPSKPPQKFPTFSEINRSDISMNLFSCMDAPEYERDFEISPKVIARKNF